MKPAHLIVVVAALSLLASANGETATCPEPPLKVLGLQAGDIGVGKSVSLIISVRYCDSLRDCSARIISQEGYEIVQQPTVTFETVSHCDTVIFTGAVRPTAKGTWKLIVEARGTQPWDSITQAARETFYIHLSDTLNRLLTGEEYTLLPHGKVRLQQLKGDKVIKYRSPGKLAKPAAPDTVIRRDSTGNRRSGTFNLIGSLYYEDPSDPIGVWRPAVNVLVEVWNENQGDHPPSSDVLLGTTLTDWYGCFSFWGLDNSDGDGTADPCLVWRTRNSSWTVSRPIPGTVYAWYSAIIRDVTDGSILDFGDYVLYAGTTDVGAMWCFQYINLGWNEAESVGPHPNFVWCTWPDTITHMQGGSIGIEWGLADAVDAVNHEYAHALMYQAYNGSIPHACSVPGHQMSQATCECLAWTEGWAIFFPLVVTPDGQFNWDPAGSNYFELESNTSPSFQQGPAVEGRVAAALLDLWDTNNDGLDKNFICPLSFETIYTWGIQSHRDSTFYEYWMYLRFHELNSCQITEGFKAIENNTIDLMCTSCGDANSDGHINITDPVFLIAYLFSGGAAPSPCVSENGKGDANGDGTVDISDAVYLIQYIFVPGSPAPHCPQQYVCVRQIE